MNLADRAEQFLGKGIREVSGPSSHPQILEWLRRTEKLYPTDIKIDDSKYAWCGVFVGNMVLDEIAAGGGIPKPPGYFQGAARWSAYGKAVLPEQGKRGDIVVTTRPGGSHVTIISKPQKGGYLCTGGNQSDTINQSFFPYSKIIHIRRP